MKLINPIRLAPLALALSCVGAIAAGDAKPGFDDPDNWPQYHRSSNAWRFSPLTEINKDTIKKLKVAWIHQPGNITHGLQATPIILDGVLYYISAFNNVWAVDAASGKTLWHYEPKLDPISKQVFYAAASRGVTVGRGKVFIGTLDGRFIALDQTSGKEVWSTQLSDLKTQHGALFSAPPQLAGDVLFGGTTGGDQPIAGKIYAVNADTGKPAWTFEVIKDDQESWPGDSGKRGGGSAWMPGTYDAQSDTIFIGTSNAAPDFYGVDRKGDNKYTATLLAIDPKTGKLKWHRQEIPHDVWDFDSAYEALVVKKDGKDVIVHLNKSGFVFVMDKADGKLENVWQFAENMNWAKGIDPKTGALIEPRRPQPGKRELLCPNLLGARSWNHGAYNPGTGLWYSHAMEVCNEVVSGKDDPDSLKAISALSLGIDEIKLVPPPNSKDPYGRLDARDPLTGKLKWSIRYDLPPLSSVLTTAGGLVFTGDMEGHLFAYDADNGKQLWQFNAGSGARGGPVSYAVNGKQYIVIPTGLGSHAPGFLAGAFPQIKDLPGGAALIGFTLE
ncbi:pyrroloquinoline quinone-dependent dehydrogenase [Denitromonas halophila]|uniref:PQQ-binding-like beta-propeller repeat protein n=1 Tax=Denitromonas halophila TaxID=1629404 RepID=A0A557QWC3_9RHOO|nr:PQQ-binding-like beta-propeller repeat protein [Denitromonas halophila]TVO57207.1 PQQ-binding-like beta-propeller repeat protein [Denitromonas halophila]